MSPHASSSRRPKRSATAPNTGAKNRRRSQHGHDQPQFGVADPEWLRERGQGGLNEIDAHDEGDACGENEVSARRRSGTNSPRLKNEVKESARIRRKVNQFILRVNRTEA
jgi:hypothetical protein